MFRVPKLTLITAIISTLVAFAFPAYSDYVVRTKIIEENDLAAATAQLRVAEYYKSQSSLPSGITSSVGIADSSTIYYVSTVSGDVGDNTISYTNTSTFTGDSTISYTNTSTGILGG